MCVPITTALFVPSPYLLTGATPAAVAAALTQSAALSNFAFDRYLTAEDKITPLMTGFHVHAEEADVAAAVATAAVLADATIFA